MSGINNNLRILTHSSAYRDRVEEPFGVKAKDTASYVKIISNSKTGINHEKNIKKKLF